MPNVYPGNVCRRYSNCRLMVSPRGTLSGWALGFHGLRKRVFWRLLQGPAVRSAACFHATSENEYQDIRKLGFVQPICILPNGIDVPPLIKPPAGGRRRLLFLGRIHPIKGVTTLLHAWSAIQTRFRDWELHVVGPDDNGHLADVRALATALKLERLVFHGPLYGANKLNAYRSADLFVLPTHSENFGNTVAEALAAGTPAVVTVGLRGRDCRMRERGGRSKSVLTLWWPVSRRAGRLTKSACANGIRRPTVDGKGICVAHDRRTVRRNVSMASRGWRHAGLGEVALNVLLGRG